LRRKEWKATEVSTLHTYDPSQATSLSEDSWSDVLVRHRMLSNILL
jgi:hypothetical protein